MERKKRVFLSGKITGLPRIKYLMKFSNATTDVENLGDCDVFNPAKTCGTLPVLEHDEYMKITLPMVDLCDIVYVIDGENDSEGVKAEIEYAKSKGKEIIYANQIFS